MKYTPNQWLSIIDGFEKSSLTINAYCKKHNISTSRFCTVRKKMREGTSTIIPVQIKKDDSIKFKVNGLNIEVSSELDFESLSLILKAANHD